MALWRGILAPAGALVLAGCVGTPHLLRTAEVPDQPSPSIGDVKTEITCELTKYKHEQSEQRRTNPKYPWFKDSYLITATLLLQVDDYLDLTPTFNFIHPLAGAATNMRTVIASADLGGQRERTYTETFYIDSSKLDAFKTDEDYDLYMKTTCDPDEHLRGKLYSLGGDLKLDEIVGNGERSIASTKTFGPDKATSNTNPSFGSTVEFVVTRNLSALGAQWNLVHFKGPSGNNGLLNGKKVTTDKLIVTLTKTLPNPPSDNAKLATAVEGLTRAVDRDAKARQELIDRRNKQMSADANLARIKGLLSAHVKLRPSPAEIREFNAATHDASARAGELAAAEQESASSAQSVQVAKDEVTRVYAEGTAATAAQTGVDSAALANQNLQTTMILQSLNIQPR